MKSRKGLWYATVAVLLGIAVWIGGYVWFINSENWDELSDKIKASEQIRNSTGEVVKIEPGILGFSYRFAGGWAEIDISIKVTGDDGEHKFRVEAERINSEWNVKRVAK